MTRQDCDVIVVGGGITGIAFARFYLDTHPDAKLAVLEESSCVGGVWSSSFADRSLKHPADAPSYYGCIEAKHMTKYLEDYIDSHSYNGRTLRDRISFRHHVQNVERQDYGWKVHVVRGANETEDLTCHKLVVASGLTSVPNMPSFLSDDHKFAGQIIHHKQFGEFSRSIDARCKHISVLGAGKSSVDMIYECLKKGTEVHWIIRKDGEGPGVFLPAAASGRFENSSETGATRFRALFSSSSFLHTSWLSRMFQKTRFGLAYISKRINTTNKHCRDLACYHDREGALPCFKDLENSASVFHHTSPLGLIQHEDFWPLIARNVHVHRASVTSLKSNSITLSTGAEIPTDAILLGTGWKSSYPFLSPTLTTSLGLPHPSSDDSPEDTKIWSRLLKDADKRVLSDFPMLKTPPQMSPDYVPKANPEETTTLRLYNGIAPLTDFSDRSIVFLGRAHQSNAFRAAEAQAIWATAYFDGNVKLPEMEGARKRIAYMNAVSRRRYPTRGQQGDFVVFELVSYTDHLLEEVGLVSHRRNRGWWGFWRFRWWRDWWEDWVEPVLARDLVGCVEEYKRMYG